MKDFTLRYMICVVPVVLAIAAAVFIAQAGTAGSAEETAARPVDMNVPF